MLNRFARAFITRLLTPVARLALKCGLTPDAVTIIGTIGVCLGALVFFPRHQFLAGTLAIVVFVFSDTLDGTMARLSGRASTWGAFLDSTLDRVGDGAVFGGLLLCFAARPDGMLTAWFALACLVFGFVTSYARARAEGLGVSAANVGIAERADRLVVALVATGLTGLFDLPDMVLTVTLGILAVASAITVLQRMAAVRAHIVAAS
ncbi:Phosphatidylinositol phosphate synthase [Austwickia sp. TVS 96-490-7B]|uniref:phosphatidylinositol phosphate synthase n=1 Tax=Austwickia sp. TVS 96-490-7B TaxID=2830843 RepID=UPI001C58D8FC|nr:CDP-alcohol phosphatidyltransferase family protein [Austwickia sp. TVS 96-490-7B]MBW3086314.1 Phosphatidylinositol phosphate synthase [Austwickia sp. TVS 96-490-7B]